MLEDSPEVQEFSTFRILKDMNGMKGCYRVIALKARVQALSGVIGRLSLTSEGCNTV